jgi:hypothetical protein
MAPSGRPFNHAGVEFTSGSRDAAISRIQMVPHLPPGIHTFGGILPRQQIDYYKYADPLEPAMLFLAGDRLPYEAIRAIGSDTGMHANTLRH